MGSTAIHRNEGVNFGQLRCGGKVHRRGNVAVPSVIAWIKNPQVTCLVSVHRQFGEVLHFEEPIIGHSPNDRTASGNLVVDRTDNSRQLELAGTIREDSPVFDRRSHASSSIKAFSHSLACLFERIASLLSRFRPVFEFESLDAPELLRIIRHQRQTKAACMRSNEEIVRANHIAF
jgi:hypothetical protein